DQSIGGASLRVPFDTSAGRHRRPRDGFEPEGRSAEECSQGVVAPRRHPAAATARHPGDAGRDSVHARARPALPIGSFSGSCWLKWSAQTIEAPIRFNPSAAFARSALLPRPFLAPFFPARAVIPFVVIAPILPSPQLRR